MAIKHLSREAEPYEFKPIPGLEDDWARASNWVPNPIWFRLGAGPILWYILIISTLIGIA